MVIVTLKKVKKANNNNKRRNNSKKGYKLYVQKNQEQWKNTKRNLCKLNFGIKWSISGP